MAELKMDIRIAMANQETWLQGIAEAKRMADDPNALSERQREARKEMRHCKACLIPYAGDVEYDLVRDEEGNPIKEANCVKTDYDKILSSKMGFVQAECIKAQEQRGDNPTGQKKYPKTFEEFDSSRSKEAYKQAVGYSMSPKTFFSDRGWMVISGGASTGKTHLAYGIANRLAEVDIPSLFGTLEEHLECIDNERYHGQPELYYLRMETYPLLVIDGLGDMPLTKDARDLLEKITKRRCDYKLPTVITTRLSFNELCTLVGGDIARRLNDRAIEVSTGR